MMGIVDVGGGMRGVFGCGVTDFLLDNDITFDYCLGVSAGSANLASYVVKAARQKLQILHQILAASRIYERVQLCNKALVF